jgi:quercetin dioxygenase-like cupin family protein
MIGLHPLGLACCKLVDHHIHRKLFSGFSIAYQEDLQNQTSIFTNYSTTLCEGASIITTRQKTYLRFCRQSGGIEQMDIKRSGSQPSGKGPSEYFTGTVRIDPLFEAPDPARVVGASVTFEPGARTAWHTHPLGQTLNVTAGYGRVQRWGGPIEDIRPGDVIWFEPAEKHWHGAAPTTALTHIAIQERLDGKTVDWMEQVSDEQYRG